MQRSLRRCEGEEQGRDLPPPSGNASDFPLLRQQRQDARVDLAGSRQNRRRRRRLELPRVAQRVALSISARLMRYASPTLALPSFEWICDIELYMLHSSCVMLTESATVTGVTAGLLLPFGLSTFLITQLVAAPIVRLLMKPFSFARTVLHVLSAVGVTAGCRMRSRSDSDTRSPWRLLILRSGGTRENHDAPLQLHDSFSLSVIRTRRCSRPPPRPTMEIPCTAVGRNLSDTAAAETPNQVTQSNVK